MITVGRVCIKTSGRDKHQVCVVIDAIDEKHVLIEGNTRRKKTSIKHLRPLEQFVEIKNNASYETISKELTDLGYKMHKKGTKVRKPKTETAQKSKPKPAIKVKEVKKKEIKTEKPKKDKK